MAITELKHSRYASIMEGFRSYLKFSNNSLSNIRITINIVRKFHNYIGKPYVDISHDDVQEYLTYLFKFENKKYHTMSKHVTAIRKFYKYLIIRGEVIACPCDGLSIKR